LPPWRNRWSRTLHYLFFASALTALATGLLRLFFYSKGVDFYVGNPFFWVKMALYVIIATLSIKPTLTFIRWKRSIAGGRHRAHRRRDRQRAALHPHRARTAGAPATDGGAHGTRHRR
jgi:uncharacterized membrane protein